MDGTVHLQAEDPDQAEQLVAELLIPHRLRVPAGASIEMDLMHARIGEASAGLLSYGQPAHVWIDERPNFLLNLTMRGRATWRSGSGDSVIANRDEGAVFGAEAPLQIKGSTDCEQLSLVLGRPQVERQLERLLGRSLTEPLRLQGRLSDQAFRLVRPAFQTVYDEFQAPTGLVTHPTIARHLEGLMIDAILLGQPHGYTEALGRDEPAGSTVAITRAIELMEERPDESWTVVGLAQQVHLSVRALQYGFNRDYGTTPMNYLRTARLRHARAALLTASAEDTTVRDVALRCGFLHMGRFAAGYREAYGETPSATLTRPPGTAGPATCETGTERSDADRGTKQRHHHDRREDSGPPRPPSRSVCEDPIGRDS